MIKPDIQIAAGAWNQPFAVPHFRGCSGEINLAPRAYHSGDEAPGRQRPPA